ncbi:MAG: hypothetical protein LKE96_01330 [Acetobacter peroxydans]|nr:hypothetical protein [Acetobacter peroxydans]
MNHTAFMLRLARPLSALLLLLPMTVGGCGFKPLYGEQDGQTNISAEMKEIYVNNIPERLGQQLRLALQESMSQDGPEDPHKYRLQVYPQVSSEAIDIHNDNTTGRQRLVGRAHWALFSVEATPRLLTQGDTTTMDGYTSTYEQYFALTLNSETGLWPRGPDTGLADHTAGCDMAAHGLQPPYPAAAGTKDLLSHSHGHTQLQQRNPDGRWRG